MVGVTNKFDVLVTSLMGQKRRSFCSRGVLNGCDSSHYLIDSSFLRDSLSAYFVDMWDDCAAEYERKKRHVSKNHLVSKTVLGKSVLYRSVGDDRVVTSNNSRFVTAAKFGDVFEMVCGKVESLWGSRRENYFDSDHVLSSQVLKYYSRDYVEVKLLAGFLYAIHKVREDYRDQFLIKDVGVRALVREVMVNYNSVTWFITTHPKRMSSLVLTLNSQGVTPVQYHDESQVGSLLPLGDYGYLETLDDGHGILGVLFMDYSVFSGGFQRDEVEFWVGKACEAAGEIRVFYLEESFTYRTAISDAHSRRRGWVKSISALNPKKLSTGLAQYESQYIMKDNLRDLVRKTRSQKDRAAMLRREERRGAK